MKQLGEILVGQGLIAATDLEKALLEQRSVGHSLGRVLIDMGLLTEAQVVQALASQIGMRFVDLTEITLDGAALTKVPGSVCRRHSSIPVAFENGKLVVAMSDPANVFAIDDIRSASGMSVIPVVATRTDVQAALDRHYRADGELDELTTAMEPDEDEDDLSSMKEVVEDAPIVKFVNLLITQGIQDRASDIHFEPTEHDFRVRFRSDGA